MEQLSKEQAQAIFNSRIWETWTDIEILRFQLFQTNLCMPFGKYHTTLERYIGRPVYTTELDYNRAKLIKEVLGPAAPPAADEIYTMLPNEVLNAPTAANHAC